MLTVDWRSSRHDDRRLLVIVCLCSSDLLFLFHCLQMASGEELGCKTGTAVADAWSLARLHEIACKAVEEKTNLIRKRFGDQDLDVSCRCHVLVQV